MKPRFWDRAFESLLPLHLFALLDLSVIEPHDFWWHARTGEIIARTRAVPTTDSFSFVAHGARFVNEPWLSQLGFHELLRHGGLAAVIMVHALAISAGYALAWRPAKRDVSATNAAVATVLAAAVGAANWGVRPQSFSFLLFGALVWIMEEHRRGRTRALYAAAPLFALWANVHGGFTFGLLALAIHGAAWMIAFYKRGDRARLLHTGAACVAAAAACGINPGGYAGLYEHVALFFTPGGSGIAGNAEFAAMSIRRPDGLLFFFAVGRLLFACARGKTRPAPAEIAGLAVFGVLSLAAVRFAPWFGLLLLGPLARALEAEDRARPARQAGATRTGVRAAVVIASAAFAVLTVPFWRSRLPLPPSRRVLASVETPIAATGALCPLLRPGARVFADQGFASYLIDACPEAQVFLDTRIQLYDARAWDEYDAVVSGRYDAASILAAHGVDAVMLRADQRSGARALVASGAWRAERRRGAAVVLVPVPPPPLRSGERGPGG